MKLNGLEKYFKTNEDGEIVDFKQIDNYFKLYKPLIFALYYNKDKNLNLNSEHFNYLIKNSDLKDVYREGWTALQLALYYKKDQKLNFSNEIWKYLIDNSDISLIKDEEKLITLKKIQSELINNEILSKIEVKENNIKIHKL